MNKQIRAKLAENLKKNLIGFINKKKINQNVFVDNLTRFSSIILQSFNMAQ